MSYTEDSVSVQPGPPSRFETEISVRSSPARDARDTFGQEAPAPRHAIDTLGQRRHAPERWTGLRARIARDRQTRNEAFHLRHLCYASKGYIDARQDGLFHDDYDADPRNTTIVVYEREQPIGSVRVCTMASPGEPHPARDLPVAHVFPSEMQALLAPTTSAVEINRLVSHPDHAHSLGLVFILIRMSDYLIRKYNPDLVASCVRNNHVGFYKRLQFEKTAGPRLYTGLKFMTTLMVLRQERYGLVRRTVPVLDLRPEVAASYETMWDGREVSVFGDD